MSDLTGVMSTYGEETKSTRVHEIRRTMCKVQDVGVVGTKNCIVEVSAELCTWTGQLGLTVPLVGHTIFAH